MKTLAKLSAAFVKDEDGAALTEYLVLLGLITAGTVGFVIGFGDSLGGVYEDWSTWVTTNLTDPGPV